MNGRAWISQIAKEKRGETGRTRERGDRKGEEEKRQKEQREKETEGT